MLIQNGLQPIHYAAQAGKQEVVKFLVEQHNISVNTCSDVSYVNQSFASMNLQKTCRVDFSQYIVLVILAMQIF